MVKFKVISTLIPVAQQGAQNHQAVLHAADDLCCAVSSEQQLATVLETGKCKGLVVPLSNHQLQFLLNIPLFHCTDTDVLEQKPQTLMQKNTKKETINIFFILTIHTYLNFLFILE